MRFEKMDAIQAECLRVALKWIAETGETSEDPRALLFAAACLAGIYQGFVDDHCGPESIDEMGCRLIVEKARSDYKRAVREAFRRLDQEDSNE